MDGQTQQTGNGAAATDETERERGTTTRKPVLVACARIGKILDDLSETERKRAVRFIVEEYETDAI